MDSTKQNIAGVIELLFQNKRFYDTDHQDLSMFEGDELVHVCIELAHHAFERGMFKLYRSVQRPLKRDGCYGLLASMAEKLLDKGMLDETLQFLDLDWWDWPLPTEFANKLADALEAHEVYAHRYLDTVIEKGQLTERAEKRAESDIKKGDCYKSRRMLKAAGKQHTPEQARKTAENALKKSHRAGDVTELYKDTKLPMPKDIALRVLEHSDHGIYAIDEVIEHVKQFGEPIEPQDVVGVADALFTAGNYRDHVLRLYAAAEEMNDGPLFPSTRYLEMGQVVLESGADDCLIRAYEFMALHSADEAADAVVNKAVLDMDSHYDALFHVWRVHDVRLNRKLAFSAAQAAERHDSYEAAVDFYLMAGRASKCRELGFKILEKEKASRRCAYDARRCFENAGDGPSAAIAKFIDRVLR